MKRAILSLFVLGLGWAASAHAVEYTNAVLDLGVGGRALGMGGAYVGLADDSTAAYWNPAGLTGIKDFDVQIAEEGNSSALLNLGTNTVSSDYYFLTGGMTVPGVGSFGVAVMRFEDGGIPEVSKNLNPDGSPDQIGTFSDSDTGLFLSYARPVWDWLDLGASLKSVFGGTNGLVANAGVPGVTGDASYNYFGLDLGAQVQFGRLTSALDGLTFGINLQDLVNSGVKWSGTPSSDRESVSCNPKTGLAYGLPFDFLKSAQTQVNLALDVDPVLYSPTMVVHYGAEVWYRQVLAFRGGIEQYTQSTQSPSPSLGLSLRLFNLLQFDYAYIYNELTNLEYADLAFRW